MMSSNAVYTVDRIGVFTPKMQEVEELSAGEVGYITASIKSVGDCRVGDTITDNKRPCTEALPGFKPSIPVVFCSIFPVDSSQYEALKDALAKLKLNDASIDYQNEIRQRWDSAFAVASSDCCIWKSYRSESGANLIWTLLQRHRPWRIKSI